MMRICDARRERGILDQERHIDEQRLAFCLSCDLIEKEGRTRGACDFARGCQRFGGSDRFLQVSGIDRELSWGLIRQKERALRIQRGPMDSANPRCRFDVIHALSELQRFIALTLKLREASGLKADNRHAERLKRFEGRGQIEDGFRAGTDDADWRARQRAEIRGNIGKALPVSMDASDAAGGEEAKARKAAPMRESACCERG